MELLKHGQLILAVLTSSVVPAVGAPMSYQATLLHPLVGNYTRTDALDISGTTQVGSAISTSSTDGMNHAVLWNGTAASIVDINPPRFLQTSASGIDGNSQVGGGSSISDNLHGHALLWHGTAASAVDLHPAGFNHSYAEGVSGDSQVGIGYQVSPIDDQRALLWRGTAASAVNLHPAGFQSSVAVDVEGDTQVGYGYLVNDLNSLVTRALMWHGTAASFVNLHPPGFVESRLEDISGNTQVGYGEVDSPGSPVVPTHALLWHGTAANFVDLHPAGFARTVALGAAGDLQVGSGLPTGSVNDHALVWNGTAGSAIDLHQFLSGLPIDFVVSQAFEVGANGMVVGIGRDSGERTYAVLWTPIVPAPTSCTLCACALFATMIFSRRNRPR